MKWQILVDGHLVEVDPNRLDGVLQVEPGVYSVLIGGRSFEARIARNGEDLRLDVDGRRLAVEVRDPRNRSRRERTALGGGRQSVTAPMPGKVVRVLVREGDMIDTGQGLVVVEAMKMQNEMKAVRSGQVLEVRVRDGDTVGAGDTLVVVG